MKNSIIFILNISIFLNFNYLGNAQDLSSTLRQYVHSFTNQPQREDIFAGFANEAKQLLDTIDVLDQIVDASSESDLRTNLNSLITKFVEDLRTYENPKIILSLSNIDMNALKNDELKFIDLLSISILKLFTYIWFGLRFEEIQKEASHYILREEIDALKDQTIKLSEAKKNLYLLRDFIKKGPGVLENNLLEIPSKNLSLGTLRSLYKIYNEFIGSRIALENFSNMHQIIALPKLAQ